MDYSKQLELLGLTSKEASFYTKALELGQFTVSTIAHESGLKRPTCYLIIDELIKKGLITTIPRGRKFLYHAEAPEILIKDAEKRVDLARKLLPHLQQIRAKNRPTPTIQFFTGRRGIEAIYNDVLKTKSGSEVCTFTPGKQLVSVVGKEFLEDWIQKRSKKGISSRNLLPVKDKSATSFVKTNPAVLRQSRYLPEKFNIAGTIGTYGDKVAFFSSKKDNFGFIVKSDEFTKTIKGLFEFLWEQGDRA